MKYLILLTVLVAFNVIADTEITVADELSLADEAIQAPSMNIEGQYQMEVPLAPAPQTEVARKPEPPTAPPAPPRVVRRVPSASERIKAYRARLELRNQIMIEKKMEQIRYQQELALAKQLEKQMNHTLNAIDNIQ